MKRLRRKPIEPAVDKVRAGPETKASSVYNKLRTDIVDGVLQPGQQLAAYALADNYEVAMSPVPEALNRLTQQGLIARTDHRGFRVAPASVEDLLDVVGTRCRLEEVALRESIRLGDARWEEHVLLAHHRLARSPHPTKKSKPEDRASWEANHRNFHLALISGCGSRFIVQYCAELQQRLARYRNLSSLRGTRSNRAMEEHREICDAALRRDADRATALVTAHFRTTADMIASSEASMPLSAN